MEEFDNLVNEAFSNVSFLDVGELRTLYYGRLDLYASFGDDGEHELSGKDGSDLLRPKGIASHSINNIVGRKVSSPYFYANVFRFRPRKSLKAHSYSLGDYNRDFKKLSKLSYIDEGDLEYHKNIVDGVSTLRGYFDRIWSLTRALAGEWSVDQDRHWSNILQDIGYDSVEDPKGRAFMVGTTPVMLILDPDDVIDLDIVPVQKYRKDRRINIQRKINKKNRLMWVRRNRIAKVRTDKYREMTSRKSLAQSVAEFRALFIGG